MPSLRGHVEAALDDLVRIGRWRFMARRKRLWRLYHLLRADGVKRSTAMGITARTRRAAPGVRKTPAARPLAVDLIIR